MALSPALCPRLGVVGGGRRVPPGGGRLSGCLFVYGPRKLYWFYTPACFEIKERFQGGGGSQPPEPREQPYLFFGPWLSPAWSSEVCSGAGPRGLALCQGQGGHSGARGAASLP